MTTVTIAVTDEDPEFGSRIANSIKLEVLLAQATSLLQTMFKDRWAKYRKSTWDADPVGNASRFINGIGQKYFRRLGQIQKEALESGNVETWDITMLTDILIYVDFDQEPVNKPEMRHLKLLKEVRNTVSHKAQAGIADPELEALWSKAEKVLLYFGWDQQQIQKLKNSTNVAEFENQDTSTVKVESSQIAATLKEEGNQLYKEHKFWRAVEVYTTAIALDGLSQVDRGILHSNRASAYLELAVQAEAEVKVVDINVTPEDARHRAVDDAKEAIRLRPAWYKGYYRAGTAYHSVRKYEEARRSFDWALSLAPGNKEILQARDESRRKLGIDTRNEHLDTRRVRFNAEDQRKHMEEQFGRPVTKELYDKIIELDAKRTPGQADVNMGHDYYYGTSGMKQDYQASVGCYSKAAGAGNAEGLYWLGRAYNEGTGVKQDFAMSVKLFKEAASKSPYREDTKESVVGVSEAEHALGLLYSEGVGVPQDYKEARKWYERGSEHGSAKAANNLAIMYREGKGVPLDFERAAQYWHLSAMRRDAMAMESLAGYYLTVEHDPVQAHHWYELAITNGNLNAKLNKKEFDAAITKKEKEVKEMEKEVTEWETKQGFKTEGLNLKERLRRMMTGISPDGTEIMDNLKQQIKSGNENAQTPVQHSKFYDRETLARFAAKGSKTAEKLLKALEHFQAAMKIFESGLNAKTSPAFFGEIANCCRYDNKVIQVPAHMGHMLTDWKQRAYDYLKKLPPDVMSSVDQDTRICCSFLNKNPDESALRFVEASMKKYPNEQLFHMMTSNLLAFQGKYKLACKVAKDALKSFPGDVDLLYNVAELKYFMMGDGSNGNGKDEIIQAYKDFLDAAPNDHRFVPLAYYAIGLMHHNEWTLKPKRNKKKMPPAILEQIKKSYKLGLAAEKIQLPYYLPYASGTQKPLLETFLRTYALIESDSVDKKSNLPKLPLFKPNQEAQAAEEAENLLKILTSPLRIKGIKEHRETIQQEKKLELLQVAGRAVVGIHTTTSPKYKQSAPTQLAGLRSITFKDMNMFQDKVYENCVLAVRSIEDPASLASPSIRIMLEDGNRDVVRAFIYNFGVTDRKQIVEQLGVGAKLSIINPYLRIGSSDGACGIRVDDRSTIFLHSGSKPTACRFCGKEDAQLKCGSCKRAFYCNRECQETDWKKFGHKLICAPSLFAY